MVSEISTYEQSNDNTKAPERPHSLKNEATRTQQGQTISSMRRVPAEISHTRELFIDLTKWEVAIRCDVPQILSSLKAQFGDRARFIPWIGRTRLSCEVISNSKYFVQLQKRIRFNGPMVRASPEVDISYAFEESRTWLYVAKTAIIELDDNKPTYSRVYLARRESADSASRRDSKRIVSEPEAFMYPLLAEWIRNFDACLVHCGTVALDNRTIILSGPPGSGKSTHVLRLLLHGTQFLADDLAIIHRSKSGLEMMAFREVANVGHNSLECFPELQDLANAPLRGDDKYCIDVSTYFNQRARISALPGVFIRLYSDAERWMRRCPEEDTLANIHSMAWFVSRNERSEQHFWLLSDWLLASSQWNVSQGYLAHHIDKFLDHIRRDLCIQ